MAGIVASVVGVILTALIALAVTRYRSLITYDIVGVSISLKIEKGEIVPAVGGDYFDHRRIRTEKIVIENRGFKGVDNARFHISNINNPFSITKKSSSIVDGSIKIKSSEENGIEVEVDHFPRKEKIEIFLGHFGNFSYGVNGAGSNYICRSISYFEGRNEVIRFIIFTLAGIGSAVIVGALIGHFLSPQIAKYVKTPEKGDNISSAL